MSDRIERGHNLWVYDFLKNKMRQVARSMLTQISMIEAGVPVVPMELISVDICPVFMSHIESTTRLLLTAWAMIESHSEPLQYTR